MSLGSEYPEQLTESTEQILAETIIASTRKAWCKETDAQRLDDVLLYLGELRYSGSVGGRTLYDYLVSKVDGAKVLDHFHDSLGR